MKQALDQTKQQLQQQFNTLMRTQFMLTIATVLAYIIASTSFLYKSITQWYADGGKQQLINNTCKLLQFINKIAERSYYALEQQEQH